MDKNQGLWLTMIVAAISLLTSYYSCRMPSPEPPSPQPPDPQALREFLGIPAPATHPAVRRAGPAKTEPVVHVVDGDTGVIKRTAAGASDKHIRFLRISMPERGEPGFTEARAALKELLGDDPVRIEFEEPGVPKRDSFGRLLVYVYNAKGQNVSVEFVRQGWSEFETRYGEGRLADEFRKAQMKAVKTKRGLWKEVLPLIGGGGDAFEPSAPVIRGP